MLVATRHRGFQQAHRGAALTVVGLITGLLLFGFFTVTVRFFHILHLALGRKGSTSAIELRQRKGLFALQVSPRVGRSLAGTRSCQRDDESETFQSEFAECLRGSLSRLFGSCCYSSSQPPASRWH